jgi:hypothetical protein
MKKLLLLLTIIFFITTSQAQNTTLPDAISKAFAQKFPKAKKVKWTPEDIDEYEADFEMDSTNVSSTFDVTGKWLVTETDIPLTKLPIAVSAGIKKNYPKAKIRRATKIDDLKKGLHYEVEIKTGEKTEDVYFFDDGREMI